jgi:hypothetical protein
MDSLRGLEQGMQSSGILRVDSKAVVNGLTSVQPIDAVIEGI